MIMMFKVGWGLAQLPMIFKAETKIWCTWQLEDMNYFLIDTAGDRDSQDSTDFLACKTTNVSS